MGFILHFISWNLYMHHKLLLKNPLNFKTKLPYGMEGCCLRNTSPRMLSTNSSSDATPFPSHVFSAQAHTQWIPFICISCLRYLPLISSIFLLINTVCFIFKLVLLNDQVFLFLACNTVNRISIFSPCLGQINQLYRQKVVPSSTVPTKI